MTKPIMREARIPFQGFYASVWDDAIDYATEQYMEWKREEESLADAVAANFSEYIYRHATYGEVRNTVCREYAAFYALFIAEKMGGKVVMEFSDLTSPRAYNFETDKLYATLPLKVLKAILALQEVQERLPAMLIKQHKGRDGFISFYSHELGVGEWAKPVSEWDSNQWHTVLLCLEEGEDNLQGDALEYVSEALDNSVSNMISGLWEDFIAAQKEEAADIAEEADNFIQPLPWAFTASGELVAFNEAQRNNLTIEEKVRYGVTLSWEEKVDFIKQERGVL